MAKRISYDEQQVNKNCNDTMGVVGCIDHVRPNALTNINTYKPLRRLSALEQDKEKVAKINDCINSHNTIDDLGLPLEHEQPRQ